MPEATSSTPDPTRQIKNESSARLSNLKSKLVLLNTRAELLETENEVAEVERQRQIHRGGEETEQQSLAKHEVAEKQLKQRNDQKKKTKNKRQQAEEAEQGFRQAATLLHTAETKGLFQKEAEAVEDQLVKAKIDPTRTVTIETAASDGYETHEFKQLAKLAFRLGRPVTKNGRPLLSVLSRPETKHFLAMLAALQRAYNTSASRRPTALLRELETPDLAALVRGFANHLDQNRPGFLASNTYKWRDLTAVAEDFFEIVNGERQSTGTELYRKLFIGRRLDS